ncbi:hypothetical protein A45J_0107 [hot springs metagenome]|uniref:Uncharacterized protein n=1 Tax=hot springs metagenome TaxID=433727 RepID=A0A5J4KZC9_9ZZZZ
MSRTIKTLLLLVILLFTGISYAYDEPQYSNTFLLSVYFKAVELRDRAISELRKIDMEIRKNEETIQRSENIISLARQRSDAKAKQAEVVAREALMKAQEAKAKNEETRKQWELQKIRADRSYATIQNMLSQNFGSKRHIKGFVTNSTGNVYIIKANGDKASPENGFLEPGDKVWTGDGTAEMQMLDGRGTAKIGPYSEFAMKKDTPEEQVAELLKGKVYMVVDKVDEYARKMKEKIEQYKEDLQTIKQLNKEDINELIKEERKRQFLLSNSSCYPGSDGKLYCLTWICAVRGTKFTSEIKEGKAMEITVLEGVVDVNIPVLNKSISITEGTKAVITMDGIIKQEKAENTNRWWER